MPIWLTILLDILKALFAGDFKNLWIEHKDREADNAENKVNSMSDNDVVSELSKWTKPE